MVNMSNAIVPLPNFKQGQNGVEVALAIYKIIVDVKAHLPGPKEVAVNINIVVTSLLFDDCHFSSNKQWLLLCLYYPFIFFNQLVLITLYYYNRNSGKLLWIIVQKSGGASVMLARTSWKKLLAVFSYFACSRWQQILCLLWYLGFFYLLGEREEASFFMVMPPRTNDGQEASSSYYRIREPKISPMRHAHSCFSLHTIRGGHVRANLLPTAVAIFVSGSVAGAFGVAVAFPLDTLKMKVRMFLMRYVFIFRKPRVPQGSSVV